MASLVSMIDVARPPQEVFAVATDPLRFAEWQPDVVRVQLLDKARFATTRQMPGGERTFVQEITRNDPPNRWAVQAIDGPIRPHASITVESIGGGTGSRVTFTLDFEGHGLGVPLVPLVRRQAQNAAPTSYENLKNVLERAQYRASSTGRRVTAIRGDPAPWVVCHLDRLLADRQMTLTELAERVGVTVVNLSILKNDRARAVRFSTLTAICEALHCQPGDIFSVPPQRQS